MHYAKLKVDRLLADQTRLKFGRDSRDLDGNPGTTTRRAWLRCRGDFHSSGPGHRLCVECRKRATDASPYAVYLAFCCKVLLASQEKTCNVFLWSILNV